MATALAAPIRTDLSFINLIWSHKTVLFELPTELKLLQTYIGLSTTIALAQLKLYLCLWLSLMVCCLILYEGFTADGCSMTMMHHIENSIDSFCKAAHNACWLWLIGCVCTTPCQTILHMMNSGKILALGLPPNLMINCSDRYIHICISGMWTW